MVLALTIWLLEPVQGMSEAIKRGLRKAFRHLLVPLVRILIRHGVSFGEFAETVKAVYVDVASREFQLPGRKQSDSRVAILTGLTRKEVYRLRHIGPDESGASNLSRVARVIQGWNQDPDFVGPYGVALEIPFQSESGPNFVELCRRHSGDMSPRAMLDELLRVNAVTEGADGYIRITNRTYLPAPLDPAGLERLGKVVHYFVDTVDLNLRKKKHGEGRFERYALTLEGIDARAFPDFDQLVRQKGQELLETLDNWLTTNEVKRANKKDATLIRTGVGVFHFIDHDEPDSEQK